MKETLAVRAVPNAQLISEYMLHLQAERALSANTVGAYISDLNQFVEVLSMRGVLLFTADKADVAAFIQHLAKHDIGARSRARKIASLRGLYDWLVKNERLDKDPTRLTITPKLAKLLPRPIEPQAMERILETSAIRASADDATMYELRNYAILEFMYGGAVRVSELCSIRQVDIELQQRTARVRGKGNKERIIPLGETAIQAIENYLRVSRPQLVKRGKGAKALFLSDQGRAISRRRVGQIVHMLGGENVHPHRFRHSAATDMLTGGADLRQVQEMLGHANLGTTEIYTKVTPGALQDAHRRFHPRGR